MRCYQVPNYFENSDGFLMGCQVMRVMRVMSAMMKKRLIKKATSMTAIIKIIKMIKIIKIIKIIKKLIKVIKIIQNLRVNMIVVMKKAVSTPRLSMMTVTVRTDSHMHVMIENGDPP